MWHGQDAYGLGSLSTRETVQAHISPGRRTQRSYILLTDQYRLREISSSEPAEPRASSKTLPVGVPVALHCLPQYSAAPIPCAEHILLGTPFEPAVLRSAPSLAHTRPRPRSRRRPRTRAWLGPPMRLRLSGITCFRFLNCPGLTGFRRRGRQGSTGFRLSWLNRWRPRQRRRRQWCAGL